MDELEISGKRYISSRRAGEEHRYHADYIGQLIRSGKVAGTKVGRAWYVEAASLAEYLGKETPKSEEKTEKIKEAAETPPPPAESLLPEEAVIEEKVAEVEAAPAEEPEAHHIPVIVIAEEEPLIVEVEEEEKDATQIVIKKTGGLRYISDDEPLFPIIHRTPHISNVLVPVPQEIMAEKVPVRTAQKRKKFQSLVTPLSIGMLGCATLLAVAVFSSKVTLTTTVEQGKPASVQYAFR